VREFSQFVLQFAPDTAEQLEQALTKGYVVFIAAALLALFVLGSTIIFSAFYSRESWSALDAFYFTIVSYSTIGFGDFSPDPHPSWFAVVFITATFFGLSLTAIVVRAASDPAFDWAFTVRQLSPRTWDRAQDCRHACVSFLLSGCGLRSTAPMMATHQLHEQPHERSATTDAAGSQLGATTEAVGAASSGMLRGCA